MPTYQDNIDKFVSAYSTGDKALDELMRRTLNGIVVQAISETMAKIRENYPVKA